MNMTEIVRLQLNGKCHWIKDGLWNVVNWKPLLEEKKGLQSDVWLFSSTWSFPSAICHFVIFDTAVVAQIALVTIFFLYDTFLHTFIKFFVGFTMINPDICFLLFMMYLEYDVFLKVFFVVIIPKLIAHFHNTLKNSWKLQFC